MNRGLKTLAASAALTLSLGATLAGCGSSDDDSSGADSALDLVKSGTLTVCSDVPYPPFEDFDKSAPSGFKGFDIDIVTAVAESLDLKLAVKDSSFDALQSGLAMNSGDCDLAASAMTITPERAKKIGFSDGYYDSEQSLLVPAGSSIKSIKDLSGKKVGVQKGTTGKAYTEKNAKGADIKTLDSDGDLYLAIKAGNIEAILQDLPVNLDHQNDPKQPGKYKVVETYKTDESYGLAMSKKNTALLKEVNKALAELKSDGDYQKIYDKYFATN